MPGKQAPPAAPATGANAAPTPPTAPTPTKRLWGQSSQKSDWVKIRSLVDTATPEEAARGEYKKTFRLVRVTQGNVTPKEGENAGVPRASYIFEMGDGKLFSANVEDSIGHQVRGFGIPPPGTYRIRSQPSDKSSTGDALLLEQVA